MHSVQRPQVQGVSAVMGTEVKGGACCIVGPHQLRLRHIGDPRHRKAHLRLGGRQLGLQVANAALHRCQARLQRRVIARYQQAQTLDDLDRG